MDLYIVVADLKLPIELVGVGTRRSAHSAPVQQPAGQV
uniref:VPS29 retromer complex component n=1 Tax=Mus musculus TaxID=10090 RepID=D6RH43_MOUSE